MPFLASHHSLYDSSLIIMPFLASHRFQWLIMTLLHDSPWLFCMVQFLTRNACVKRPGANLRPVMIHFIFSYFIMTYSIIPFRGFGCPRACFIHDYMYGHTFTCYISWIWLPSGLLHTWLHVWPDLHLLHLLDPRSGFSLHARWELFMRYIYEVYRLQPVRF